MIELLDISPSANEVLGLDLAGPNLAILCALLDIGDQFLLLVFKFDALAVEFSLRLFQCALVLPESLRRRHALAESPFYNLVERSQVSEVQLSDVQRGLRTFMLKKWCTTRRGAGHKHADDHTASRGKIMVVQLTQWCRYSDDVLVQLLVLDGGLDAALTSRCSDVKLRRLENGAKASGGRITILSFWPALHSLQVQVLVT